MLPGVGCYVSRYWVNDQQFPLRSLCQKSKDLNYDVAEAWNLACSYKLTNCALNIVKYVYVSCISERDLTGWLPSGAHIYVFNKAPSE